MKTRMWVALLGALLLTNSFTIPSAYAVYNANLAGVMQAVLHYDDSDLVLFRLVNQPTSHPLCNPSYFAIDPAVTADRRKAMVAHLLLALANKEEVNIGYDNAGNCANGYVRTHRVG